MTLPTLATLYLDLSSGLSGDMFLAALIDLGVPTDPLEAQLRQLPVHGYHLHIHRASKSGIQGTKFDVHLDHDHDHDHDHHSHDSHGSHKSHSHSHSHGPQDSPEPHTHGRSHSQIRHLIAHSTLNPWVQERALSLFQRIAIAEGKIHGCPPEDVQFHEVGAVDSIVDIIGACLALDALGRPRVLASPVVEGTGFVRCAHGRLPLPAPATLEILAARGIPLTQCDEPHEMLTPTGAALLAEFAEGFHPLSHFAPQRIGYGLGTRDHTSRPNVLRAALGHSITPNPAPVPSPSHDWETDTVTVLETNLDDTSPEILGDVMERALALGALDAFHTPVQMKKQRPGVLVTLLSPPHLSPHLAHLLLSETSAFGVRETTASRRKLHRQFHEIATPYGPVIVKLGWLDGHLVQVAPEYDSCRQRAAAAQLPVRTVHQAALLAFHAQPTPPPPTVVPS